MSDYIVYISIVSGFLPVIAALYNYRHLDDILKIVAAYLVVSVLVDCGLDIASSSYFHVVNNYPALHIFIIITLLFFSVIYYKAFFNPVFKKITVVISVLTFLLLIATLIFVEGLRAYATIANTLLGVPLIIFSLAYFYQLLTRQEFIHIEKQGLFWINAGILLYYTINIFLFMLFDRMTSDHKLAYYAMINNSSNIISNILFTVGFLCKQQKTTVTT